MASGKRPFAQSNNPLLINAILNQNPDSLSRSNNAVPAGLEPGDPEAAG
jgi:hypothetical protein